MKNYLKKITIANIFVVFVVDILTVCMAFFFTLTISTNFFRADTLNGFTSVDVLAFFSSQFVFFALFRSYRSLWKYTDIGDIFRLFVSSLLAGALYTTIAVFFLGGSSRLVFAVLLSLITTLGFTLTRVFYKSTLSNRHTTHGKLNLAIIGAGDSGASVLNNFKSLYKSKYNKVYLFDDDANKIGKRIASADVVGSISDLPQKSKTLKIDEILIAIPSASTFQMNRIVDICLKTNATFFTLPSMKEVNKLDPKDYIKYMRKVDICDLLGRDEIHLTQTRVRELINGKTIMVTGGGGSIGSELCRQIAELSPSKLIIIDYYENNAYSIEQELLLKYKKSRSFELIVEIATVREKDKIDFLFEK